MRVASLTGASRNVGAQHLGAVQSPVVKYSIEAAVEGELYFETPQTIVTIDRSGIRYEFRSDEKGRVDTIAVILDVPPAAAETMHATFGPKPSDPSCAPPLTVHVDPAVDEAARRCLLAVESVLSYATDSGNPLVRINAWEGATSLVPETPEEKRRVEAWGISVARTKQRRPATVMHRFLSDVIDGTVRYDDLVESMAFMRDGTNRQLNGEFIQAFYAYYFIIEGLYAGGRSGEQEIMKLFAKSRTFCLVCEVAVRSYFAAGTPRSEEVAVLRPLMVSYRCAETAEGLQRFLIRMRQQLHHFSRRSTKLQPHPFNQEAFAPLADLTRFVAKLAIEFELKEIDRIASAT